MNGSADDSRKWLSAAARTMSASGGPCPGHERLAAFHAGELNETEADAVREHLGECAGCVADARDARRFVDALRDRRPRSHVLRPAVWLRRPAAQWAALAASLLLAAAAAWLLLGRTELRLPAGADRWRDLPVAKAEYVPVPPAQDDGSVWRGAAGAAPARATSERFIEAMRSYVANDLGEAERRLREIGAGDPARPEARFYLGVTLLLLGRAPEAVAPLEEASATPNRRLSDEARWYLALAWLKAGEPRRAVAPLEPLAASSGPRADEASRLLARIREASPP